MEVVIRMQIRQSKSFLSCIALFLFLMTISISSADVDMKDLEEIQYVTENEHLTFDVIAWNEKNINDYINI